MNSQNKQADTKGKKEVVIPQGKNAQQDSKPSTMPLKPSHQAQAQDSRKPHDGKSAVSDRPPSQSTSAPATASQKPLTKTGDREPGAKTPGRDTQARDAATDTRTGARPANQKARIEGSDEEALERDETDQLTGKDDTRVSAAIDDEDQDADDTGTDKTGRARDQDKNPNSGARKPH